MPKISAKFQTGHPQQRSQIKVKWVQISDFRSIYRFISETVQHRDIVTMER